MSRSPSYGCFCIGQFHAVGNLGYTHHPGGIRGHPQGCLAEKLETRGMPRKVGIADGGISLVALVSLCALCGHFGIPLGI